MLKRIILNIVFLSSCLVYTRAQEVITGLQSNRSIVNSGRIFRENRGLSSNDTLALPFFDDFSGHSVFTD